MVCRCTSHLELQGHACSLPLEPVTWVRAKKVKVKVKVISPEAWIKETLPVASNMHYVAVCAGRSQQFAGDRKRAYKLRQGSKHGLHKRKRGQQGSAGHMITLRAAACSALLHEMEQEPISATRSGSGPMLRPTCFEETTTWYLIQQPSIALMSWHGGRRRATVMTTAVAQATLLKQRLQQQQKQQRAVARGSNCCYKLQLATAATATATATVTATAAAAAVIPKTAGAGA